MIGYPNLMAWLNENRFMREESETEDHAPEEVFFDNADGFTVTVRDEGVKLETPEGFNTKYVGVREGKIVEYGSLRGYWGTSFAEAARKDYR